MWINPNHPDPPRPRPAAAPQESGERVATFQRHGGEELRVSLAEFNGFKFLSLRVWAPGQDGQLWPVRGKGLAIKLREVAGLADVLTDVAGRIGARAGDCQGDRREGPSARPQHGSNARPPFGATQPADRSRRAGLDECN